MGTQTIIFMVYNLYTHTYAKGKPLEDELQEAEK